VRRFVRPQIGAIALAAVVVALLVTAFQRPFAASAFEYGRYRTLGGTIVESPYPILLVDRPGKPLGAASSVSAYPLTVPGKHGADQAVAGLDGLVVEVRERQRRCGLTGFVSLLQKVKA
jgi:hypothetical protein